MNSSIKAIFFDIGGTLRLSYADEERTLENIQQIIALLGEETTPGAFIAKIHKGEKAYRKWCKPSFIELPEAELWTRFLLPEHPAQFIREHAIEFNQLWRESRRKYILPDMVDTMRALSKRGYKLGLISNTTSTVEGHQLLVENGLTEIFSCVILSAAFGRRKPHPSLFLAAARQAGVLPQECCYVGDRPSRDLVGARQAGYGEAVIINTDGYEIDEFDPDDYDTEKDRGLILRPDHHIRKLGELLDYYPEIQTGIDSPDPAPVQPPFLYEAALSTMWGVDQVISFDDTFEAARKIGFSRFELNHRVSPELLSQVNLNRFYVCSIHDPCPAVISIEELKQKDLLISSLDDHNRRQGVDILKRTIELAGKLGAKNVIVHPGSLTCDRSMDQRLRELFRRGLKGSPEYETLKEEMIQHRALTASTHLDSVVKSLSEIIDFARGSGILLGLENRYRYYDIPLADEMEILLDLCHEDWYGFQLDTGHAHSLSVLGLCELDDWLVKFGGRLIGVHLHDVIGVKDHQAPGLGDVDFKHIAAYLPDNAYKTLEIGPQASIEQIASGMEHLVQSGCVNKL